MSFQRPTLSEIIARTRGDIESRLPGADASLRHSALDILARAHGGATAGLYGYLDWLARQLMPDTAEAEHLARWASIWGVRRKAATVASGTVVATGQGGAAIAEGSELVRGDGALYRTTAPASVADGEAVLSIEAKAPGLAGQLVAGSRLTFSKPVGGVDAEVIVATTDAPGSEEETDAALLERLLARIRKPPQGGALHDYIAWTLAQPGVTRAWAWADWMGAGTVGVAFVMDDRANILPLEEDIEAVEAALDMLRPVTAELYVFAPIAWPVDVVVRIAPDTAEVRAAIEAELADFFARDAEPGGTIYTSRMGEAISLAAGEFAHTIDLPERDLTAPAGRIPMLGEVTFV